MDNSNSNAAEEHDSQDCIKNLGFVPTTNGRYDYIQARQVDPTGDCAVIATSIAANITYGEAHRRLKLLSEMPQQYQRLLAIPESDNTRDPIDGTDISICKLFLYTHFFKRRPDPHCIYDERTPHVVLGITDDGTAHAAAVANGKTYGLYDITVKDFDVVEVWELDQELVTKLGSFREKDFANRRRVNALLKRLLDPNEAK